MVYPRYKEFKEVEASIDKMKVKDLREKCKALTHSNRQLLYERGLIGKSVKDKFVQTEAYSDK